MINLEKEFKELIANDKDYLLFRNMLEVKCNCWRKESNTPNINCTRCDGHGFIFKEFISECKYSVLSLPRVSHEQDYHYGKSYSNVMTIYLTPSAQNLPLKIDDQVYIMEEYPVPHSQIKRRSKWLATDVIHLRTEQNHLEVIKMICKPVVI